MLSDRQRKDGVRPAGRVRWQAMAVVVFWAALALPVAPAPARADDGLTGVDIALQAYRQPGGPCDATWREEFRAGQGRSPGDEECLDRVWSLRFMQVRGRPPTLGDWERHFFLKNPPKRDVNVDDVDDSPDE